jgi:hypothetical protein
MRARHQVLLSLCIPLFALSAACTDAVGPVTIPGDPALLQSVTLSPAEATLTAGSHLAIHATPLRADGQPATAAESIVWASSNTKVATVSAGGDVMAVAPGSATITATVGDVSATAPFTIVPAPVESVTVTPRKIDVTVGDSVQFSAQVGGEVAGSDDVTWESSNSKVATVSSDGIVSGVTAGTASIRAKFAGRTAKAAVSVVAPPPPPKPVAPPVDSQPPVTTPPDSQPSSPPTSGSGGASGLWVHQPSGLATLTNQSWNSVPSLGWTSYDARHNKLSVVADPTVPTGDPTVLQLYYPTGFVGGSGPALARYQFSAGDVYIGFYWKLSPNWQGHVSGINKLLYVFQRRGDDRQAVVLVAKGPVNGPYRLELANEPNGSHWLKQNMTDVHVRPGEWHKIEMHLKRSSSDGAPDGIVEWWVDGQLAARYTSAKLRAEPFSEVHVDGVWGGAERVTKTHPDYQRFGRFYISGQ